MDLMQQLGISEGQRIFITPFTPMSEKLARDIQKCNLTICGFIDSNKKASNVVHPSVIKQQDYDRILVISPNYGLEIYQRLLKEGVVKHALTLVVPAPHYRKISYSRLKLTQLLSKIKPASLAWLQNFFRGKLHDDKTVLLLASGFVDLNIKDLYVGLCNLSGVKPVIATDNVRQKYLLREAGFKVVELYSWQFVWLCLRAKVKVLDHSPIIIEQILALKYSLSVQIWHGIPLKKIGHLINYKMVHYDLVVSTSPFVTQYAFANLFSTERFIETGYPRNDVLKYGVTDERQLALVNQSVYQWVIQRGKPLIVYMPTWRGDSFDSNPIDLEDLEKFANENDITIVIKMHPFIRPETFFDTLESDGYFFSADYKKNIVFYPSTDDIYPLLHVASVLVTDYSSVYFDYLLLDKPIVFFVYDLEQYKNRHGDFMLDFESHTPGDKSYDYICLKKDILSNLKYDNWKTERQSLRDTLFSPSDKPSAQLLCMAVYELLKNKKI
jgi:CDP-glycerol glycerophosphotransferase (TagB/SpsB family)